MLNGIRDHLKRRWLALPRLAQHLKFKRFKSTAQVVVIYFPGGIGDYLLFRPFLSTIVGSEKFTGHRFVLLGNELWKDWFEHFDAQYVSESIWLDPQRCQRHLRYRYQIMKRVNALSAKHLWVPSLSRHPYIHDDFIRGLFIPNKWGTHGDLSKLSRPEDVNSSVFTHIFNARQVLGNGPCFEWDTYRAWVTWLTGQSKMSFDSQVQLKKRSSKAPLEPYLVCFIGGSSSTKKWSRDRWVTLIQKVLSSKTHAHLHVMICGGQEDMTQGSEIVSAIKSDAVVSLCGQLNLIEFAQVLKDASCLIAHEGCAQHMAHAVGLRQQVILYNGLHFGRFIPYPQEWAKHQVLALHPHIARDPERYRLESRYATEITLNMNDISAEMVWDALWLAMPFSV